jgi:hypothetical protein
MIVRICRLIGNCAMNNRCAARWKLSSSAMAMAFRQLAMPPPPDERAP